MNKTKYNRKIRTDNTSGTNGVWWRCNRQRWACQIKVKGKQIWLGQFINKFDAIQHHEDAEWYFNFIRNK
jgi:hypothetical protein